MVYGVSQDYSESGFEYEIRVHQFGGPKIVWVFGGYASYHKPEYGL